MKAPIRELLASAFGDVEVLSLRSVGGGSINETAVVQTDRGTYFAKWNRRQIADQFEREAAGLTALREANTLLRVPEPIAWDATLMVMEYLEPTRPRPDFDAAFGRGLAELHRNTAPRFGFLHDNYCGATPQPNPWMDDWAAFYGEHRIRHQVRLGGFATADVETFDALIARLPALLETDERPALIHGDLWSGNQHNANGAPALIDPAVYYAHREAELGMMQLFGGFSARTWDAYDEAYPLVSGWRDRLPLYELYHVLNHFTLFGGGYGSQALRIARRFL